MTSTWDLLRFLNDRHLARHPGDSELLARVSSYELAARMQLSAAEVGDFSKESPATLELYGVNDRNKIKAGFARNCLLARRLIERGVRFVQLFNGAYAMGEGVGNWDGRKTLKEQYRVHAPILDQPCAALLKDLKARGLLGHTLVVWLTDFGRTPKVNAASGRDHWAGAGFAIMAGAGVPGGAVLGRTDAEGGQVTHDQYFSEDLAATVYTKLGIPLDLTTSTPDGRPIRLNEGRPIREWL